MSVGWATAYKRHMSEAVRWLDRASLWKRKGFEEASRYCTGRVRNAIEDLEKFVPGNAPGTQTERMRDLKAQANRIDALPPNDEAFLATVAGEWNGHRVYANEQQQEAA